MNIPSALHKSQVSFAPQILSLSMIYKKFKQNDCVNISWLLQPLSIK